MIGHSFGAWILFASTSPFILETLASGSGSDVEDDEEPRPPSACAASRT